MLKLELELDNEFIKKFMEKHKCSKKEVLPIICASLLEDKESDYYRSLGGAFDIKSFLISHSITQLATMRSEAMS